MNITIKFVPQDCWVGLFWKDKEVGMDYFYFTQRTYYLCLIPCFPIIWNTKLKRKFSP